MLDQDLQHQTRRGLPLTPMQQVLIALRFYATGTFQRVIGDLIWCFCICCMHSHSQGFKGYCETKKDNSCHSQRTWLIPRESFMMLRTFQMWSGPSIVPTSGSYVQTKKNAIAFGNRKQFYFINVQAVCGSDAFIINIVARWPGSTHDLHIFDWQQDRKRIKGCCSWWHSCGW